MTIELIINIINVLFTEIMQPISGGFSMFERIKNLLVEELSVNPDDVTPGAELINDLGINSLELADLVLLCEERFDVVIEDSEVQNFVTVGDVVEFLESKDA